MVEDLFPWVGTGFRYFLYGVGAFVGLAVLWYLAKFVRFMRTAR